MLSIPLIKTYLIKIYLRKKPIHMLLLFIGVIYELNLFLIKLKHIKHHNCLNTKVTWELTMIFLPVVINRGRRVLRIFGE